MNKTQSVAAILLVIIGLSGCGHPKSIAEPAKAAETAKDEVQSVSEREMVILFQILIRMDKHNHLTLTAVQAEQLLPLIQRNSREGEMTPLHEQEILSLLDTRQKQFVLDWQNRAHRRIEAFEEFKGRQDITPEQRDAMISEFRSRRSQERAGHFTPQLSPSHREDHDALDNGAVPARGGVNLERELMALLEGKLRSGENK
ncbi:hypothetical protein [Paenibacillus xerothermodurans]|uniref:Uncharacterized protein n=1 Tax=Paenibacillus xerothermodurans TaxID=1977292 RepID=A0A2W1NBQ3_PAEXE|nr:hypothetical protein [Paenibacillus xerothermodurans]PZE21867.1 hypothetical protein CBW46_005540 [Paenibacillus xerothermodurans]